jgi:glycine hydroxymethyltransferase
LPLYGHELAGPFNVDPLAAGFGSYVKLHKPYFIGRKAFIENALNGSKQIVRFRMNEKGVRMPNLGDPVVNRRGKCVGAVTSCAIDSDNFLTGLAYVEKRAASEGTQIGIFVQPRSGKGTEKPKGELEPGDAVQLPNWATIVPRFRMRE